MPTCSHSDETPAYLSTPDNSTESANSWVEIGSHLSSSSLSSSDIVTTGLRVEQPIVKRQRRRLAPQPLEPSTLRHNAVIRPQSSSSLGDYDESDSEFDRVLTVSAEEQAVFKVPADADEVAVISGDDQMTLLLPANQSFTPQTNAFNHSSPMTNRSRPLARPRTRHSYAGHEARSQHGPFDLLSPSVDAAAHTEAALRTSLNTLLSCAAAARSFPKGVPRQISPSPRPRQDVIRPSTLRLIPESQLPGRSGASPHSYETHFRPTIRTLSTGTSSYESDAHKRKPLTLGKDRRQNKRRRRSSLASSSAEEMISPTIFAWVVSAGVVVIIGALGFSAGYAIGKEAGATEAAAWSGAASDAKSCAREAARSSMGLQRLRIVSGR